MHGKMTSENTHTYDFVRNKCLFLDKFCQNLTLSNEMFFIAHSHEYYTVLNIRFALLLILVHIYTSRNAAVYINM